MRASSASRGRFSSSGRHARPAPRSNATALVAVGALALAAVVGLILVLSGSEESASTPAGPLPGAARDRSPNSERPAPKTIARAKSGLAAELARAELDVDQALARDDLAAAHKAAGAFRYRLVGKRVADRFRDAAASLEERVERRASERLTSERRRFRELLRAGRLEVAGQLLARLARVDHPLLKRGTAAMRKELDARRNTSRIPDPRPEQPRREARPASTSHLVASFGRRSESGKIQATNSSIRRVAIEDGGQAGAWRIPAGNAAALTFTGLPADITGYRTIRLRIRAVQGFEGQLHVWLHGPQPVKDYLRTTIDGVGQRWRTVDLALDRMRRSATFAANDVRGASLLLRSATAVTILIDTFSLEPAGAIARAPKPEREEGPRPPRRAESEPEQPESKPEQPESATRGTATLVLTSGMTFTGKIPRAGGAFLPEGFDYAVPGNMVAWFSETDPPRVVMDKWGKRLARKLRENRSPAEEWMSYAKFLMFNDIGRSRIPGAVQTWRKLKNRTAGSSPWNVSFSRHYVVVGQLVPNKLRSYTHRLEMILVYYQRVLRTRRRPGLDFVVRIYGNRTDYVTETRSGGSAGLYLPIKRELAIQSFSDSKRETIETIFHEAAHQYINEYYKGYLSDCHWFEEGIAEYFSTARLESGRIIKVGGKLRSRLDRVKLLIDRGGQALLQRMWRMSYDEFYNSGSVYDQYALSWALVHYFMNTRHPAHRKAWLEWMRGQPKYDKKTWKKLFEKTMGQLDLTQLFEALSAYVRAGM